MSISLDHNRATQILLEEAEAARRGDRTETAADWLDRVRSLTDLCPHGRSATVFAALGTAILAKATDDRVDVYSLLDRGEAPDSYSARSLADNVWARHRGTLEIDLGANGANPLNNTPFIGKTRIDEITGVRNQTGWIRFIECMEALKAIPSAVEARQALRGFITARRRSLLPPIPCDPAAGDHLTVSALVSAIDTFVAGDSEGGRRAQAGVAAILDATFAPERVIVGVINDPDRHAPLDVSVMDENGEYRIAFEVKDKPIEDYHVRTTIEKTVKDHSLRNLAFVAVSKQQTTRNFDGVIRWAGEHGVNITVFLDWYSFFLACKSQASTASRIFEGVVFRRLLARGSEIGVAAEGLDYLRALTGSQSVQSG